MAKVLTVGSTMQCGHGGTAVLSGNAKLTVNGKSVLLESDFASWSIAVGCSQTNTNASEVVCAKVLGISAGKSSKLTVSGKAVLTDDLEGSTSGAPKNTDLSASSDQSILEAP